MEGIQYLQQHNIQQLLKSVLHKVVLEQPSNPWPMVVDELHFLDYLRGGKKCISDYSQEKELGNGAFGIVHRARQTASGRVVAMKAIAKKKVSDREVRQEFEVLQRVVHKNVLRVFDLLEDDDNFYIISELCGGGSVLDAACKLQGSEFEEWLKVVVRQVLQGLQHCHERGIMHHDIKPENILCMEKYSPKSGRIRVVLADFGTARERRGGRLRPMTAARWNGKERADYIHGTPEYCPPEVFKREAGALTDVYSLGASTFELIAKETPFERILSFDDIDEMDQESIFEDMISLDCEADGRPLRKVVSEDCVNLTLWMMKKHYKERPTLLQCLEHPWLASN